MNREDEALLAEAERAATDPRAWPMLGALITNLANRVRELATHKADEEVGYYWVRDKAATSVRPFILEKSESGWYSSGSEDSYDSLPDTYEVVCPVKFVDPKCRDGAPCGACAACTLGNVVTQARTWLETADPAISGSEGHKTAFRVIEQVVRGFDLTDDEALFAIKEWNARCLPPWSTPELRRKIWDAREGGDTPIGGLRNRSTP